MKENLEHKVDSVEKVKSIIGMTACVLFVVALCLFIPMMVIELLLFGMLMLFRELCPKCRVKWLKETLGQFEEVLNA